MTGNEGYVFKLCTDITMNMIVKIYLFSFRLYLNESGIAILDILNRL